MHERKLMDDLVREIGAVAEAEGATRVSAITVRLGALSHLTPDHFREHFLHAARGSRAAGAAVEAVTDADPHAPHAQTVLLESVELEFD